MTATQYVNTNLQDTLAYPYVLRVTFAEDPSPLVPDFLAAEQLAGDVGNVVNGMSQVAGVAIASSTDVPPGAQAFTIDFAPTDPNASIPVNQILAQITGVMTGPLEFLTNTFLSRVEKLNASAATGGTGAVARGAASDSSAATLASNSFGAQLTKFLGSTENLLLVGAGIAGLFYFGPEIKAGIKSLSRKRRARA